MFWYSSLGHHLFNNTKSFTDFQSFNGNRSGRMLNQSWRNPDWDPGAGDNSNAILPMLNATDGYSFQVCSYFVEKASYLRLQNVVLGYSLPRSLISKATIQNLRIYAQLENALTFTKYSGLDPAFTNRDVSAGNNSDLSRGIDAGAWPNILRFIVGVNLTF